MLRAVIDIETIPNEDFVTTEVELDDLKRASLDASTARVACVGVILVEDFVPVSARIFLDSNEHRILQDFWGWIARHKVQGFIAHNGLSFDLPFLWRRSVVCKVKPTMRLDLKKFSNNFIFDTMNVWSNWEPRSAISLDKLALTLGLGNKTGDGSQVHEMWKQGRFSELSTYCLNDCKITYQCFCRLSFEEPREMPIFDECPSALTQEPRILQLSATK